MFMLCCSPFTRLIPANFVSIEQHVSFCSCCSPNQHGSRRLATAAIFIKSVGDTWEQHHKGRRLSIVEICFNKFCHGVERCDVARGARSSKSSTAEAMVRAASIAESRALPASTTINALDASKKEISIALCVYVSVNVYVYALQHINLLLHHAFTILHAHNLEEWVPRKESSTT